MWIVSWTLLLSAIFLNYPLQQIDSQNTPFEYGLYDAVSVVFMSIASCNAILRGAHNFGGNFDWFYSHRYWRPVARLSYAIYLTQFSVISITMGSIKTPPHLDGISLFVYSFENYFLSIFVAIIATLAIELPFDNIQKLIFDSSTKQEPVKNVPIGKTSEKND